MSNLDNLFNFCEDCINLVEDIDWDLLHKQKYELLAVIEKEEEISGEIGELQGIIHLIDALQDVAAKNRIWKFPEDNLEDDLIICQLCLKEEYRNCVEEYGGKFYCETCYSKMEEI